MSRVRLIVVALAGLGIGLAGCSALPDWVPSMPGFGSAQPAGPQLEAVQFESQPPGAEVRTDGGQTCLTPCSLSVPAQSQAVTINKIGFIPQSVQITAGEPPDHSFWESAPPPTLVPNPVQVVLQPVPPPARPAHRAPRHVSSRTRTAAKLPPRGAPAGGAFPDPPPQQGGGFPPPAADPGQSPFPPPPGQGQQ